MTICKSLEKPPPPHPPPLIHCNQWEKSLFSNEELYKHQHSEWLQPAVPDNIATSKYSTSAGNRKELFDGAESGRQWRKRGRKGGREGGRRVIFWTFVKSRPETSVRPHLIPTNRKLKDEWRMLPLMYGWAGVSILLSISRTKRLLVVLVGGYYFLWWSLMCCLDSGPRLHCPVSPGSHHLLHTATAGSDFPFFSPGNNLFFI